ncbi:MAG TPA: tetraacyldisaccharide 4'-kinase [Terracidiphilus sp.]|nr:tetraacyldisaccharide 4'-kinase [Terracidiphilus sp.]
MIERPWLAPLTPLYRLALGLRELELRSEVQRLRWPVISIGNLSTGGSGKTPLTITLARALSGRGVHVDVLSRGYGRVSRAAMHVDLNGTAEEFGDEPLEIARAAGVPVFVAARRYEAGVMAEAESPAGVHLLDDGFQHRRLHRDVDIVLVSARDFRDRLLPAGNLREPLRALLRATCMAISADDEGVEELLKSIGWQGPVWRVRRRMEVPQAGGPVIAFCGIARPEQFFAGLEAGGMLLAGRIVFADHHRYTANDVERLREEMRKSGAVACVTTEKDRVRLGRLVELLPLKTAALRVEIEDEGAILSWLRRRLAR